LQLRNKNIYSELFNLFNSYKVLFKNSLFLLISIDEKLVKSITPDFSIFFKLFKILFSLIFIISSNNNLKFSTLGKSCSFVFAT
jgi:hypothetical protein